VEDHKDTRHTLSRLLTHFGHQISVAADKQSALNILASSQNFDVILCDIGLPDGSGYEVIFQAKRRHPVKAVAITGFGTEADVRRSTEAGFDFHLVKPVDLRELQGVLDQVGAEFACNSSSRIAERPQNGRAKTAGVASRRLLI